MNLTQIRYFLEVADKLNFTAAAKELFVSQPALSRQISALEEELGTKLFIRNSKKVALTNAGTKLKNDLSQVLEKIETARHDVIMMGQAEKKIIRVGCFDGVVVDDFINLIIQRSSDKFPNSIVKISRYNFSGLRKALASDEIDMILTLDFETPELMSCKTELIKKRTTALIYSARFSIAHRKNLTINDFDGSTLFVLNPEVSQGCYQADLNLVDELKLSNLKIEIFDDFSTLLTYLEMGLGFVFLSSDVVNRLSNLLKIDLPPDIGQRSVIAAWKKDNQFIQTLMAR